MISERQEYVVSDAFSRQSRIFDDIYENNSTTVWMRDKVRKEVLKYIKPGSNLLELNCGTGIDSLFFAKSGFQVLATDNAPGMLAQLDSKIEKYGLKEKIRTGRYSFNELEQLRGQQFDYIFSNFSGLNCTEDLGKVLRDVDPILKSGGHFTFVIMPKTCPWELIMMLKGDFKMARRRYKKNGTSAHIEGVYFTCYYYNPSFVLKELAGKFKLRSLKGLAAFVPPPFIEDFPEKHPAAFSILEGIENRLSSTWPFNQWCDQYAITMQKL